MRGNVVRDEGICKNLVRISMYDYPMETAEYVCVNICCMLDWIIGFCHKTAEIHFLVISCFNSECAKWDSVITGRDEVSENSNVLQGSTFDGTVW